jgi:exportin-1
MISANMYDFAYRARIANFTMRLSVQQKQAQQTLTEFKQNPDAWLIVGNILQESSYLQTKYLALQVLDDVIMTRWKVLPREQCLGKQQESRVLLPAHD